MKLSLFFDNKHNFCNIYTCIVSTRLLLSFEIISTIALGADFNNWVKYVLGPYKIG